MAQSIAARQFPQIAWQDGKKLLWNPILRQRLKNRPEERVRLRVIDYLLQGGWSKHRISTEESLSTRGNKDNMRTDLICYTSAFDPLLLVECKAEQITISEQTANQIARYNYTVSAPYLLMTNGVTDYWYHSEGGHPTSIQSIPVPFPPSQNLQKQPLTYWQERGFAGKNAQPRLRKWLKNTLNGLFLQRNDPMHFLSFKQSPTDLDLDNYYCILHGDDCRLALSLSSTPFGGTRLIGIINNNGQNMGMLEVNLDLLFDERTPNATTYSANGSENADAIPFINPASHHLEPALFFNEIQPLLNRILN